MRKHLLSLVFGISVLTSIAQIIPNGDFEISNTNWNGNNFTYNTILTVTNNGWNSELSPVNGYQFMVVSNTSKSGEIHNQFFCTIRPDTFSFHVGYFRLFASEAFGVDVLLSKWDTISHIRDTICYLHDTFVSSGGQIIPWTVQNLSLSKYYRNSESPDSACISFFNDIINPASSTTFMVLDECKWGSQSPSNKTFVSLHEIYQPIFQVYYSNGKLNLNYFNQTELINPIISVINANGQIVFTEIFKLKAYSCNQFFETPLLINGIYIVKVQTETALFSRKFIVQN